MAIIQLDKITLYGPTAVRRSVLAALQELGCVHLVNLAAQPETAPSPVVSPAHQALRYLKACTEKRRPQRRTDDFDLEQLTRQTIALEIREQQLREEIDELGKAIDELRPWGNFQLPVSGELPNVSFWFYKVRHRDAKLIGTDEPTSERSWQRAGRDQEFAYYVVAGTDPGDFPGQQVALDSRPLETLLQRREAVEDELEEAHHQRVGLTRWIPRFANALHEADDRAALEFAAECTWDEDRVFAIQGWSPREYRDQLTRFAAEHQLALTVAEPLADDAPPTLLRNPESIAGGQGLVTFYKTPAYRAWDPSAVAYYSFAIFFAMILADAGYGAVLALLLAYRWRALGSSREDRRMRRVFATVVACSLAYGVLCGSYFGFAPADGSALGRLALLDASAQEVMMPLTILVGVVHLSLANLVMVWLHRGRLNALGSLGWVVAMIGATVAGVGLLGDTSGTTTSAWTRWGSALLVSGLASVFLFSSERPLLSLSPKNHLLRLVDGLQGLAGVSGLFGDVLSYLRLFALGLSSAKLAETFNALAKEAWDNAGFGVIAAIAIMFIGHTLNLLLGIMSGVVHGLRLNCIEFFKWSLPEEGYLFSAFKKKASQT